MRAAILNCTDAPKWLGYTERLWGSALRTSADDIIETFDCYEHSFPDPETCHITFDVIVIGGSHHSAYDDLPWIRQLESLLPRYVASGVRLLGCCFGHQLLSRALGGDVGRNPSGRFVLGVEAVELHVGTAAAAAAGALRDCGHLGRLLHGLVAALRPAAASEPLLPAVETAPGTVEGLVPAAQAAGVCRGNPEPLTSADPHGFSENPHGRSSSTATQYDSTQGCVLRVLQSHGDQVLALPPGAVHLATSATCRYEAWALGGTVLSFQFHPELTPGLIHEKIWPGLTSSGRLSGEESAAAAAGLLAAAGGEEQLHSEAFLEMVRAFIAAPQDRGAAAAGSAAPAVVSPAAAAAAAAAAGGTCGGQPCPLIPEQPPQPLLPAEAPFADADGGAGAVGREAGAAAADAGAGPEGGEVAVGDGTVPARGAALAAAPAVEAAAVGAAAEGLLLEGLSLHRASGPAE